MAQQLKEKQVLNEANEWTDTWTDLPKYAGSTTPIEYTVEETVVPTGYTVGYSVVEGVLTVTNTHIPETVEVPVEKVWVDGENQGWYQTRQCNRAVISKWHSS